MPALSSQAMGAEVASSSASASESAQQIPDDPKSSEEGENGNQGGDADSGANAGDSFSSENADGSQSTDSGQSNGEASSPTVPEDGYITNEGTFVKGDQPKKLASRSALPAANVALAAADSEDVFKVEIPYKAKTGTNVYGTASTTSCNFAILNDAELTCEVVAEDQSASKKAISSSLDGWVEIPEKVKAPNGKTYTVTQIGTQAFGDPDEDGAWCKISAITLPQTITKIGEYSFSYCSQLKNIYRPSTQEGASSENGGFSEVVKEDRFTDATAALPAGLETVGRYAFFYCTGFDFVSFSSGIKTLEGYSFCQANGLNTVEFEGDAPSAQAYSFTGQTDIKAVIYNGAALSSTNNIFNSDMVLQPNYYYAIHFYPTKADAAAQTNLLANVIVNSSTTYKYLYENAPASKCELFRGMVPSFPENTNIWRFSSKTGRNTQIKIAQDAWPEWTSTYDLSLASNPAILDAGNMSYTGEEYLLCASAPKVRNRDIYESLNGVTLDEGIDYSIVFQRKNVFGVWADTEDTTSTGDLRVVATGIGLYTGQLIKEIKISLGLGSKFICDIPSSSDPDSPKVKCAFQVMSFDQTTHSGTVSVVKKTANKNEDSGQMSAVPIDYEGSVYIPETIQTEGALFSVTEIDRGAFYPSGKDENKDDYKNKFVELTIPKTIEKIGATAFYGCSSVKTCYVYCDLDKMEMDTSQFSGMASRCDNFILYGRAPTTKVDTLKSMIPARNLYFTIKFLDNYNEYEKYKNSDIRFVDIPAISQATIHESAILANIPDTTKESSYLYPDGGYVPEYPDSAYSDYSRPGFEWGKPTWMYPEVQDGEQEKALRSSLQDSTLAYAANDVLATNLDTGFVIGIEDGKQYDYTGSNVIIFSNIKVYPSCGGLLEEGVDYEAHFEYKSPYSDTYEETTETKEPGLYKYIVEGIGEYGFSENNTLVVEFSIYADEPTVGTKVSYPVTIEQANGKATQVYATFQVLKVGAGRALGLWGDAKNSCIYNASAGKVIIPERITFGGFVYSVEEVGQYAFVDCSKITSVSLPKTITNYDIYAFKGCSSLTTVAIEGIESSEGEIILPPSQTNIPSHLFDGCSLISDVDISDNITSIEDNAFASCGLSEISLPKNLVSLGANAFKDSASLKEITLPASLNSYSNAFAGSLIEKVKIEEGATNISDQGFLQASKLVDVDMPSTMTNIGEQAFSQTALTEFTVSKSLRTLGKDAFLRTTSLQTVIFEGDANALSATTAFQISSLRNVVYRAQSLVDAETIFTSKPTYYSTIRYYKSSDDYAMGASCGFVSVKSDTAFWRLATSDIAATYIYDGFAPALPSGSVAWTYPEAYSLGDALGESTYAIAASSDMVLTDLSQASVATNRGYVFTGSSILPIENGTASVILPNGKALTRTVDYSWEYQRKVNDQWAKTSDYSSEGELRIKVSPAQGSMYSGAAYGYFTIVRTVLGSTFQVSDPNGNMITYKITKYSDGNSPGEVQVGTGTAPMSINSFKGEVVIPESVISPTDRFTYLPTSIGYRAFYRQVQVTSFVIPSCMKTFYRNCFAYEEVRGDTKSSNLVKVVFNNDLSNARVGYDIFLGCDLVNTVIYGSHKGRLEEIQPFNVRPGVELIRYYTVRYYEDEQADPMATIIVKEGCYPASLSNADYYDWENEDIERAPKLKPDPETNTYYEWLFETTGLNEDERLIDSLNAYKVPVQDDAFTVMIDLVSGSTTSSIPCIFTPTKQPEGDTPGEVLVGRLVDGMPAISILNAGKVVIPEQIKVTTTGENDVQTSVYNVTSVGAFAFGASFEEEACTLITGIDLPSTIKTIEQGAFINCANLASLDGIDSTSIESIGAGAFMGCSKLQSLVFPETLTSISASAFSESGIVRAELPSNIASLGKSAFKGCSNLEEVVFGGAYGIDIPAVSSATSKAASADTVKRDSVSSKLMVLEDYLFAECPKLARVVFELDANGAVSTGTTFEETPNVKEIYYGGKKAMMSNGEIAKAQVYYSVNYFDSIDKVGTPNRLSYVCLKAGSILGKGGIVCGSIPSLPAYHEWIYDFNVSAALSDSGVVYKRLIPYKLDASQVDSSFTPVFTVNGLVSTTATFGQSVTVFVGTGDTVKATGFSVLDSTGKTIVSTNGLQATFNMPGSDVRLVVRYEKKLAVEAYTPTGSLYKTSDLNISQLESEAGKHSKDAIYSGWGQNSSATVMTTSSYVTLKELFSMTGMRFTGGSTVIFENTSLGDSVTLTYNELYSTQRYCFPQIQNSVPDGKYEIEPALCVKCSTSQSPNLDGAYQLVFGQTTQEFDQLRNTVSRWMEGIDLITLIMSPEDLSNSSVGNISDRYNYTGAPIAPMPIVYNQDGHQLMAGSDYQVSYVSNTQPGTAQVVINGIRDYTGTKTLNFKIVRAQPISGSTAAAYSYQNALQAYPNGSKGVIVVSSSSYIETLSASALSQAMNFPVLYTAKKTLSSYCTKAINQMKALSGTTKFRIVVIGSTSAISKSVYTKLQKLAYSKSYISRIAGNDRYLTANAVCNYGTRNNYWGDTAIVVSGKNYYDALAISAYSAWKKAPILLCKGTSTPATTKTALKSGKFKKIIVVGNTKRVSNAVAKALKKIAPVTRLTGATRYSTSLAVSKWCITQGMAYNGSIVISGTKPAYGLSAATLAAKTGSLLLLTSTANRTTLSMLGAGKAAITLIRFAGPTSAVPASTRTAALSQLGWDQGAIR